MESFSMAFKSFWYYLSFPLFEISGNRISLLSLLMAMVVLFTAIKLAKIVEKMIGRVLEDKEIDRGVKGSIERIGRYIVMLSGVLVSLDTVGISLSSLAAISAVLMVGIGFGLQNVTLNFISGLIILLERPIKVGDMVELEGVSGRVHDIRARSTLIHTRDDIAIIVPNSKFISEQVINQSFSGEHIRLHMEVGVSYGSDVSQVVSVLKDAADRHRQVLKNPAPNVIMNNFGDSSLDFKLLIWVRDNWNSDVILSDLRLHILELFREHDIQIPYPQRDIHVFRNSSGELPPVV